MADRQKQIEEIKQIFIKARNSIREPDGWFEDLKLHNAVGEALIVVGKEYFPELADEVYPYLNDPFPEFRAEAVRTLGWNSRLGINEFCEHQAYQIWEQDVEEEVKIAALAAWGNYYSDTKNPSVIEKLYNILISLEYSSEIRAWALELFILVSDSEQTPGERFNILELGNLKNRSDFDKAVDWDRVHRVMQECLPGWKK